MIDGCNNVSNFKNLRASVEYYIDEGEKYSTAKQWNKPQKSLQIF